MSDDINIVSNEGTASVLKTRFVAANIPIEDDGIFQILSGVYNFMRQNSEVWSLFKDFRLGLDIHQFDLADSDTHAAAAHAVGQMFKSAMDSFCLSTTPLDEDHFTFIGIFSIILTTYPAAYLIIESMLDDELIKESPAKSKVIH